jgi:ADP-ribose pyrophosphatase
MSGQGGGEFPGEGRRALTFRTAARARRHRWSRTYCIVGQNATMKSWNLLRERPGSAGFLRVMTRTYELPDGTTADWDILTGTRTVAVLALTDHSEAVLVRQFRPGPAQVLLELPGGLVEAGETVEAAAARELLEETGFSGNVSIVASTWLSASASVQRFAAVARSCVRIAAPTLDDGKFCETEVVSLSELRAHLSTGQLTDTDIGYLALDAIGLLGP